MQLRARRDFWYAGQRHKAGDLFTTRTAFDATLLTMARTAEYVVGEPPPPPPVATALEVPDVPAKRPRGRPRKYARRDLQAED